MAKPYIKKVKIKDELGKEIEEDHLCFKCDKCGREIDNMKEGFFGHAKIPNLVLCEECYKEIVKAKKWNMTHLKSLLKEIVK